MDFNKLVKEVIGPFLAVLRFVLKDDTKGIVEYENEVSTITLSYDFRRSFEVDVTFFFKANSESYSYSELREYLYDEENKFAAQIINENDLKVWMEEVRHFLQGNLKHIIDNNIKVCFELDGLRREKINSNLKDKEEALFKKDIEKLWHAKDYAALINVFKKYNGEIDGSVKKKYEYALKMVSKS